MRRLLKTKEEMVGRDWDGVTVLQDDKDEPAEVMPDYILGSICKGDIKSVLRWINANRKEDRVNAIKCRKHHSRPPQ